MKYVNPDGAHVHHELWKGGYAGGTVRIFARTGGRETLIGEFTGTHGGGEYGEHS